MKHVPLVIAFVTPLLLSLLVVSAWGYGWGTEKAGEIMMVGSINAVLCAAVVASAQYKGNDDE